VFYVGCRPSFFVFFLSFFFAPALSLSVSLTQRLATLEHDVAAEAYMIADYTGHSFQKILTGPGGYIQDLLLGSRRVHQPIQSFVRLRAGAPP
jgi:hypothetical protein